MEHGAQIEIRRLIRKDLEEVLAIEKMSFPAPWSRFLFEQEFLFPQAHLLAAADPALPDRVWGYLCFRLAAEETHILNLAVHPQWRRQGVGGRLLEYVVDYSRAKGAEEIFSRSAGPITGPFPSTAVFTFNPGASGRATIRTAARMPLSWDSV